MPPREIHENLAGLAATVPDELWAALLAEGIPGWPVGRARELRHEQGDTG
jgi:hypothetical protein